MTDLSALEARIFRLERSRARLQKAVVLCVLGAAAALTMAQASPGTITVREISFVDSDGRVTARLGSPSPSLGFPALDIRDENNSSMAAFDRVGGTTSFSVHPPITLGKAFGGFAVNTANTIARASIFDGRSSVEMSATDKVGDLLIGGENTSVLRVAAQPPPPPPLGANATPQQIGAELLKPGKTLYDQKTAIQLAATAKDATLSVHDGEDFQTQVGNTNLVTPSTGSTSRTSAASVMLFSKDQHVLWQAP